MATAIALAGYTPGKADLLRWAMGKKKKEILDREYESFSAGMGDKGGSDDAVKTIWGTLVPFSGYAVNKAHAAREPRISSRTASPKAHSPRAYTGGPPS